MRQHFGASALVARGDLDDVVEHHDAPVGDRVEDLDALKPALFLDDWRALELHRLGVALVETLLETGRHCFAPRNCASGKVSASAFYGEPRTVSRVCPSDTREEKIDDWVTKFLA